MGTYEQAKVGELASTGDPRILAQLAGQNEALDANNKTLSFSLSKGNLGRWFTPVEIPTEQSRESASFGTLATADEVKSVTLGTGGLIVIAYRAIWKASVASAGRAAVFIGLNQLKAQISAGAPEVQEVETPASTALRTLGTSGAGLVTGVVEATTFAAVSGQVLTPGGTGGLAYVFVNAGTYDISVQYRATSGKVTAKERALLVGVIGGV